MSPAPHEPAGPGALIGAWALERFQIAFSDGRPPLEPFGPDAQGRLIYSADGQMSAHLSRPDRPPLPVRRLEASSRAPAAAKAAAFDGYLSYAGRWRLEGDEVVHAVELASTPNIVGLEQRRTVSIEPSGARMTLRYGLTARSGIGRTYTLIWRRVSPPGAAT